MPEPQWSRTAFSIPSGKNNITLRMKFSAADALQSTHEPEEDGLYFKNPPVSVESSPAGAVHGAESLRIFVTGKDLPPERSFALSTAPASWRQAENAPGALLTPYTSLEPGGKRLRISSAALPDNAAGQSEKASEAAQACPR
jgi:hypothetical protein